MFKTALFWHGDRFRIGEPWEDGGHFKQASPKSGLCLGKGRRVYSRLRDASNPKAHQAPQDQDPAVNWCKSTKDSVVQGPEHADL